METSNDTENHFKNQTDSVGINGLQGISFGFGYIFNSFGGNIYFGQSTNHLHIFTPETDTIHPTVHGSGNFGFPFNVVQFLHHCFAESDCNQPDVQ